MGTKELNHLSHTSGYAVSYGHELKHLTSVLFLMGTKKLKHLTSVLHKSGQEV